MDIRKIKKLIELVESSQLTEMEIKEGEESIRLSRGSLNQVPLMVPAQASSNPPTSMSVAQQLEGGQSRETSHPELPAGERIKSPMVGTYYSAPTPGADAFVEVGQRVETGEVLCIIEAMKIFNQIEAEHPGVVRAMTKEDGDPVEYGEILFVIE